tara:strand:+ start:826 stop:2151 length:1326 start_codon:yes stop_codon:yes gene_type:complete
MKSKEVLAEDLFTFERLDLVVKYKFAEMIHHRIHDPFIERLYTKHIFERVGNKIAVGLLPDGKKSIEEYVQKFKDLYLSIRINGYYPYSFIEIAESNGSFYPTEGAHRTSICRLLNLKIPTKVTNKRHLYWGIDSFKKPLISDKELNFILYNYFFLKDTARVFVIFPPAVGHADQIKKKINSQYKIKHELNLHLDEDWQLKNLLREMYSNDRVDVYKRDNCSILKKYNIIKQGKSHHFLILFAEANTTEKKQDIKKEIREELSQFVSVKDFITVHASDSIEEKNSLLNVFLNQNTLFHIKTMNEESELVDSLLKDYLLTLNKYKIKDSIVVGSTPLDLFGLRKTTDIDFCLSEQERKEKGFDQNPKKLGVSTDIVSQKPNYLRGEISDYALMTNPNYYFVYRGLKFATLEVMKKVKSILNRKKDIKDCLLIDNFIKKCETI